MNTDNELSIIETVRSWKEQNASEYDFDIERIIASAQERESNSSEKFLDPPVNPRGGQEAELKK